MDVKETKAKIIAAGHKAVEELIKIAEEPILGDKSGTMMVDGVAVDLNGDELSADKLKNAAATKKLAIFDAFEILSRIEEEDRILNDRPKDEGKEAYKGFAERRAIKK
jgi:hypothetical protein